ncbi:putative OPA3-like protein CG13603 [Aplysia californica]|uniref:OPA3-like protein CG13603 n=1 Tax=Aplysia californica TaxID=6500 RepID=A0ABM0JGX3_APLCA|nr:putative OPA3-like protein CG13603 [Aplysia californica]
MAPFPLVKLGYLALKQISKPIANYIKRRAKANPFFRRYICMPPAQIYNWAEINIRLRMVGLGSAKNVEPLSEKEAIELGGEMLGEFIVFSFAAILLLSEYARSSRKEQLNQEKAKQEGLRLNAKLQEMGIVSEIQEAQIRELQRRVDVLSIEKEKNRGVVNKLFGSKQS